MSERPDIRYADTQKQYDNPLVRIAPDTFITDDPEVVRRISSVGGGYTRSTWYHSFRVNPSEHNMISPTDDGFHDFIKSRTAAGYSFREVSSIEGDINATIDAFVALLRTKYISTKENPRPADWAQVAQYFTLDTLSKVALGKEFGCLQADEDIHDFMELSKSSMGFMTLCTEVPFLRGILTSRLCLAVAGSKTADSKGAGALMRIAQEAVAQRFRPDAKVLPDMLEDIDHAISEGRVSTPITYAEAKALPYLQAVINEARRYHPTIVATFPKVVPRQGDTLAGQFVPGGTKIGLSQRGLMRSKRDQVARMVDLLFGHGRYICAGKALAIMELNKIFAEVRSLMASSPY
ncbi:hypothetical protein DL770_008340 [Monosporascus sp. CRB-9-2]|nr:hypothetical protein DL770_008340 [Monosporascus sp. CRB-9-2]